MSELVRTLLVTIVTSIVLFSCTLPNDDSESSTEAATAAGRGDDASGDRNGTVAKAGSGGAGGKSASKAGAGGTKDRSDAAPGDADASTTRIAIETFEAPAAFGDWSADNSEQHDGAMSLHPPPIEPNTTAAYEYSCKGKEFNQISFWLNVASRLDGQKLDFKVDGKLYQSFTETFYSQWRQQILTLKRGTHRFTWVASTTNSGDPAFWIDTIECFDRRENENTSGMFGFQEGFVPRETMGTFVVDNWGPDTNHPTNLTTHAPMVSPSDKPAYMEFSCGGKPHNKLSFQYATHHLSTGWRLKFFVDDQLKATFAESYGSWENYSILNSDSSKAPKYKWVAETDVNGRPELWIDDIKCE